MRKIKEASAVPPALARDDDVIRRAIAVLQERLPPGWLAVTSDGPYRDRGADAVVELRAADHSKITLTLIYKRSVLTRDLAALRDAFVEDPAPRTPPTVPVFVSRYLSSTVRNWLENRDFSYLDATGNIRISVSSPAIFLRDRGADQDPWRGPGRPRGTLKGVPAARVVRALADYYPPISASELINLAGASTGATYRVLDFLEEEVLMTRTRRGRIETVLWRRMLERWSEDYGFQRSNAVARYLQPRGLPELLNALATAELPTYTVTGSLAAQRLAAYAPARLAALYVDNPAQAADELGLRAVDTGANVLLAAPAADVVFARAMVVEGVRYAAASQVAVDLLTGPGRNPAEGQALLDWMETNERQWRQPPR